MTNTDTQPNPVSKLLDTVITITDKIDKGEKLTLERTAKTIDDDYNTRLLNNIAGEPRRKINQKIPAPKLIRVDQISGTLTI